MSDQTTWQTVPGAYVFRDTAGNVHRVTWTVRTWDEGPRSPFGNRAFGSATVHALDFRTSFGPSGVLVTSTDADCWWVDNVEAWFDVRTLGDVFVPEVQAVWPIGTPNPLDGLTSIDDATPGEALAFMLKAAHVLADRLPADYGDTWGPGKRAAYVSTYASRMAG